MMAKGFLQQTPTCSNKCFEYLKTLDPKEKNIVKPSKLLPDQLLLPHLCTALELTPSHCHDCSLLLAPATTSQYKQKHTKASLQFACSFSFCIHGAFNMKTVGSFTSDFPKPQSIIYCAALKLKPAMPAVASRM